MRQSETLERLGLALTCLSIGMVLGGAMIGYLSPWVFLAVMLLAITIGYASFFRSGQLELKERQSDWKADIKRYHRQQQIAIGEEFLPVLKELSFENEE